MGYWVCYHLLGLMLGLPSIVFFFFFENLWASLALFQFFFFSFKVEQINFFFRVYLILICGCS